MHHEAPHSRLFVHTRQAIVTRMGVSVQLCAVLVLASSCVLARPSDADVTDATSDVSRASRATSEFKYVSSPHQWAYLTSTFTPHLRLASTQPSLHTPPNSWLHHQAADRLRVNHLTVHHPSFSFGLPLLKMPPPTSNLFMVFNGRLSAPKPMLKHKTKLAFTPAVYSPHPFLQASRLQPVHNAVEEPPRPIFFHNSPLNHTFVTDIFNGVPNLKITEIQNNLEPVVTPQAPQILPQVTLSVAGNNYDTLPPKRLHDDEEQAKLIQKAVENIPEEVGEVVNASKPEKATTLILKPVAKAVAGSKGVAIAAPISRAVVRKGQEVNIHFDPDAVAVVGPGGVADAHADLLVSYLEDLPPQQTEKP